MNAYRQTQLTSFNVSLESFYYSTIKKKHFFTVSKVLVFILAMLTSMTFVQAIVPTTTNTDSAVSPTLPFVTTDTPSSTAFSNAKIDFQGFIQNTGQLTDSNIKLFTSFSDYNVYFEAHQIIFKKTSGNALLNKEDVIINFIGSRAVDPTGFRDSIIQDSGLAYQQVWYYNIYPKIDLRYYVTSSGLKYDFIVKPGGNPANIAVQLLNSGNLVINQNNLKLYSSVDSNYVLYSDSGLHSYQADTQTVSSSFEQISGLTNTYQFNIGKYDTNQVLFIDPYINAAPIKLLGNADFYNYTILYNVTGSGTASDPYVFSNLNITSNADGTPGFLATGTTLYFVIENCYFETNGTNSYSIQFSNMANAEIKNNIFARYTGQPGYSNTAMYIVYSPNINITGNTVEYRQYGVQISNVGSYSNYMISNNIFNNNNYGVSTNNAFNVKIDSNIFYNNSIATMVQGQTPQLNVISNNFYNSSTGNYGIYIFGNNTQVTGNTVYGFSYGIYASSSTTLSINNNYVNGSTAVGLYAFSLSYTTIMNNNLTFNYNGMLIGSTTNLTIKNNFIDSPLASAISISSSNDNLLIDSNTFTGLTTSTYGVNTQAPTFTNFQITNNYFSGGLHSIHLDTVSSTIVTGNSFNGGGYAIFYQFSTGIIISSNTFTSPTFSIYSSSSNYAIIENNQILYGTQGITIVNSNYNTIQNNIVFNTSYAVTLTLSSNNNIVSGNILQYSFSQSFYLQTTTNNSITGNSVNFGNQGVYLIDTNFTTITNNYFNSNNYYAVVILNGSSISYSNVVKFNDFVNNYPGHLQATDDGLNDEFLFNYYSSHNNVDANGDLLADSPYLIDGYSANSDPMPCVVTVYNTERLLGMQVLYPNGGENVFGNVLVSWSAPENSLGNTNVNYYVYESPDGGTNWYVLGLGLTNNSLFWDTTQYTPGNYLIKVSVYSATNNSINNVDLSDSQFSVSTQAQLISITSNADFAMYASSGDGTPGNPYIIENYVFSQSNHTVVFIENTDAYFVFRYNTLSGDSSSGIIGLLLYNVQHGTIYNNTIRGFENGIFANMSTNIDFKMNEIYNNNYAGILLFSSDSNTITSNIIYNNGGYGIYLVNSNYDVIDQNEVFLTGFAYTGQYKVQSISKITAALGSGIAVDPSINNTVSSNVIYNNYVTGLIFEYSNDSTIISNSIFNNQANGVELTESNTNLVKENSIFENGNIISQYYYKIGSINAALGSGIAVDPSDGNYILNNTIYGNTLYGIWILGSGYTLISGNVIFDHPSYGLILDSLSSYTQVTFNEFFNNNLGKDSQAYDDGLSNTFLHNYWSDGSSSSPYLIDGNAGSKDPAPLASPIQYPVYELYVPEVTSPKEGSIFSDSIDIIWNPATDTFNHTILYSVDYKLSSSNSWTNLLYDSSSTSFLWDTKSLANGGYSIRVGSHYKIYSNYSIVNVKIEHSESSSSLSTSTSSTSTSSISTISTPGFEIISVITLFVSLSYIFSKRRNR